MSSEYIIGTVTGVLATSFGFVLTMLYEWLKARKKDQKERHKILTYLFSELEDNLSIGNQNIELFAQNVALMTNRLLGISRSPALYYDSGWRMAQANGINSYVDSEMYRLLADTYMRLTYSNAYITARESFRMSQDPESNQYKVYLMGHDRRLQECSQQDIEEILKAKQRVEKLI